MLEAMRTKEEIEHAKADAVEMERREKNIANSWKKHTAADLQLPPASPISMRKAGNAGANSGELREVQKKLEVKLEVMRKNMSDDLHAAVNALSEKIAGHATAAAGASGGDGSMSLVIANQGSVAAQAKLEAKLDLFASTTTELMKKNAELEARVAAMQQRSINTPIRRGLSLRSTPSRITPAPPTPLGESSLFATSPGSPE